jgi:hypothetical protein
MMIIERKRGHENGGNHPVSFFKKSVLCSGAGVVLDVEHLTQTRL